MKKTLYLMICMVFLSTFIFASGNDDLNGNSNKYETAGSISGSLNRIQERVKVMNHSFSGINYTLSDGKKFQIIGENATVLKMKIGEKEAKSSLEIYLEEEDVEKDKFKFKVNLSNGFQKEVKIMPETASERAIERLKMKNCNESEGCTIELKEVGRNNDTRVAYEVKAQKEARFLGLFKTKMQVNAKVDAETGEVIQSNKPWWAFLASE